MKQENQLEGKIKKFDWKEWTPLIGLYFAPKKILKGEQSQSLDKGIFNGAYHGLVSISPIIHIISQLTDKYL